MFFHEVLDLRNNRKLLYSNGFQYIIHSVCNFLQTSLLNASIIPSISGWLLSSSAFRLWYTSLVDTIIGGFATRIDALGVLAVR